MTSFLDIALSPEYVATSTKMTTGQELVVVYVESPNDREFWKKIIEKSQPNIPIEIKSYSENGNGGKREIEKIYGRLGKHLLACIDADLDFICNTDSLTYHEIPENKFIFHTHYSARESYYSQPNAINYLLNNCYYIIEPNTEINIFLTKYSESIYDSFCKFTLSHEKNKKKYIEKDYFKTITTDVGILPLNKENKINDNFFKTLEIKIKKYIEKMDPLCQKELNTHKEKLLEKGLNKKNTHLFINTHFLFESIIISQLKEIQINLQNEELKNKKIKKEKRNEIINHFRQKKSALKEIILLYSDFWDDPFMKKTLEKINNAFT